MGYVVAVVIFLMAMGGFVILKTVVVTAVILLIRLAIFMFACVVGILAFTRPER